MEDETMSTLVVRERGLEPPHLAVPDPKSGASANSATPAQSGTPARIRTWDLRLRRPLLYPAELRAHKYYVW